jgi:hypothetical protein
MAPTHGSTEGNTQAPGRIIICTGTESTLGEMAVGMRVIMKWIKSTATESTVGLTAEDMRAIGRTASSTVKVGILWQMKALR